MATGQYLSLLDVTTRIHANGEQAPIAEMQANAAMALASIARNHADIQTAVARTGAIAPLCGLVKDGTDEVSRIPV